MRRKKLKIPNILLIILASIFSFTFLTGCTQQQNNPGFNTISIENFTFNPNTLTVLKGTTVTWINNDNADHTIDSDEGLFNSETLSKGENYTYTFIEPGTYNYYCGLHPTMIGTIKVQSS